MSSPSDPLAGLYADEEEKDPLAGLYADEEKAVETPKKEERSALAKGGRIAAQFGLGIVEGMPSAIAYDVAVAPLASKEAQTVNYRENLFRDIERLAEQKQTGVWDKQDQDLYENLIEQAKDVSKSEPFVKTGPDLSIRGLASKISGVDLHPEGVAEKTASWAGFVKDPRRMKNLFDLGATPANLMKAIVPYPKEVFRGLGAGTALQLAEDGKFGPLGTIGAAVAGDIIGHSPTATAKAIANPRQTIAQVTNLLTMNNTRKLAAQQLAQDFNASGLQIDAGTLTGSPLIQMMQARLTQSGLVGTALDNFRKELSGQITKEYQSVLGDLGELTFENSFQASEALKNALKVEEVALNTQKASINEPKPLTNTLKERAKVEQKPVYQQELLEKISPQETKNSYQGGEDLKTTAEEIKQPMKEAFEERFSKLDNEISLLPQEPQGQLLRQLQDFIESHKGSLLLGASAPEAKVLNAAKRLIKKLSDEEGGLIGVSAKELIKTRRTLADIANWEMAGSDFESAYKKLVGDLNAAIDHALADNPELRNQYLNLNADYEAFKSTFENKNLQHLFEPKNNNYNSIYNEFANNPDNLRSLEDIFWNDPRGIELVNQVKRDYAQKIISKPNISERDIRDLQNVLGPEFDPAILDFIAKRQKFLEPVPAAPGRVKSTPSNQLGINPKFAPAKTSSNLSNRKVSETGTESARAGVRKKMLESLKTKSGEFKDSDQIMKEMDSIDGIRKLRRALETTPEGKQLFKELSRYKLAEMIDNKMKDAVTDQVKLGKFSNLLDVKKNRELAKELMSPEAYDRLRLLQKNSGRLAKGASKFFNASQSGTTLLDMGLVGTAVTGIMLGNPFMAAPALLKIGGSYVAARLLSDPKFLKELEKAMMTDNKKQFEEILKRMRKQASPAMAEAQQLNNEEK